MKYFISNPYCNMVLQVLSLDKMVDMLSDIKLHPAKILAAICSLLQTLTSLTKVQKEKDSTNSTNLGLSEQVLCTNLHNQHIDQTINR